VRIDLHTHSAASDGTQSPSELVACAAAAGLHVVALTDHDTSAGWAEAERAAGLEGIALVRGTEISCTGRGVSVHLLSYLHDPDHPELAAELARARESRITRARRMVNRIAADIDLTWRDVAAHITDGATVGRPHIADALVAKGVVTSRDHAFATILNSRSRYFVPHYAPDPVQAIRMIRDAGGVAVFAHPRASARGRIVHESVLEEMVEAGLAGLEVDHRDHDLAARTWLRQRAAAWGLLVTGSSDFHGAGKRNRIGENTTAPEAFEAIVAMARGVPVVDPAGRW
jgi:predicted metal-dependent phosphoesterase TrpH